MNNSTFSTYDVVKAKRPCDEEEFQALIIGSCDTQEIFTLILWVDEDHALGQGWVTRYVGKNSIRHISGRGGR